LGKALVRASKVIGPDNLLCRTLLTDCFRPYLHIYTHSNELEEDGLISLHGANLECDTQKEELLGVSICVQTLNIAVRAEAFL